MRIAGDSEAVSELKGSHNDRIEPGEARVNQPLGDRISLDIGGMKDRVYEYEPNYASGTDAGAKGAS